MVAVVNTVATASTARVRILVSPSPVNIKWVNWALRCRVQRPWPRSLARFAPVLFPDW